MVTFLSGVVVGYLAGGLITMLLVLLFLRRARQPRSRVTDPYPPDSSLSRRVRRLPSTRRHD